MKYGSLRNAGILLRSFDGTRIIGKPDSYSIGTRLIAQNLDFTYGVQLYRNCKTHT
jgi:hypothetical protein